MLCDDAGTMWKTRRYTYTPRLVSRTIYCIENVTNGKVYVGKTDSYPTRRVCHLGSPSAKTVIGRAMIEHGASAFRMRVLETTTSNKRDAAMLERIWIHLLEANDPRFGYNSPRIYPVR